MALSSPDRVFEFVLYKKEGFLARTKKTLKNMLKIFLTFVDRFLNCCVKKKKKQEDKKYIIRNYWLDL